MEETVFDYLDKRILSFYHEAMQIKKGIFPKPRFMIFYPTNVCPFNCIFCDYAELNRQKKKSLRKLEWEYLLNQFKNNGGMAIELCGGGEPLATPGVADLISYSASIGLKIGLLTNGLFIDKDKYPEIFSSILENCSYVRVSMESGSQEVFERIRRTGNRYSFEKILDNISQLVAEKREELQVSYKYTVGSVCDLDDIFRAVSLAEERGFNSVQFKPACNVGECFKEDREAIEEKITSFANKTLKRTKLVCNFREAVLDRETGCFMSAIHTLIDYHGDAYICCYYRHRIDSHKIGNVFEKNLYDVWHSFEHWRKMREINVAECNVYDCRFIRYNETMKQALNSGQLEFI